jgi:hypothetical protein
MTKSPKPKPDDAEQSARFIALAKEVGGDKEKPVFDRALAEVIKTPAGHPEKAKAGEKS